MRKVQTGLLILIAFGISIVRAQVNMRMQAFNSGLDSIRTALKIPGMAAAIMEDDSIIFHNGFGFADIGNQTPVTQATTFRVASITKTFTSTLIMQLVEQGKLDLETPISQYGLDFGNPNIRVQHLLTHTSEGEPGTHFQYNGYRYGKLGAVIERAAGMPFYQLLMEKIVEPLGMTSTAPGISLFSYFKYVQQKKEKIRFFEKAFTNLAKAYELDGTGRIVETKYLDEFGAFGGLTTNTTDLLKYAAAIDRNQFVKEQTQKLIFTSNQTKDGKATPYGLGWFSQKYHNVEFYWHYGQTLGEAGLFVKVPSRKLTLVVLTNTDKLSQPFPLGDGDLFNSPAGQLFYKHFIDTANGSRAIDFNQPITAIRNFLNSEPVHKYSDLYNKELIAQAAMNNIKGDTTKARELYRLYGELNFKGKALLPKSATIGEISNVGVNQERAVQFFLAKPMWIRIYGVGENCSGDFSSWCDYGWIEESKGKIVWQMQGQPAKHAGGAIKNQRVDTVITLPAGRYTLKYKSDSGHGYDQWDSAPPDHFLWGILLQSEQLNQVKTKAK